MDETTGRDASSFCPLCGGKLEPGNATIPFIFQESVVVVKHVPAQLCLECREPFLAGKETDVITDLLSHLKDLPSEVTILTFPEPVLA